MHAHSDQKQRDTSVEIHIRRRHNCENVWSENVNSSPSNNQIFCKIYLYYKVNVKSIINPVNIFLRKSSAYVTYFSIFL